MEQDKLNELIELIEEACFIDGIHHKQWYLYKMAKLLHNEKLITTDIDDIDKGIAP